MYRRAWTVSAKLTVLLLINDLVSTLRIQADDEGGLDERLPVETLDGETVHSEDGSGLLLRNAEGTVAESTSEDEGLENEEAEVKEPAPPLALLQQEATEGVEDSAKAKAKDALEHDIAEAASVADREVKAKAAPLSEASPAAKKLLEGLKGAFVDGWMKATEKMKKEHEQSAHASSPATLADMGGEAEPPAAVAIPSVAAATPTVIVQPAAAPAPIGSAREAASVKVENPDDVFFSAYPAPYKLRPGCGMRQVTPGAGGCSFESIFSGKNPDADAVLARTASGGVEASAAEVGAAQTAEAAALVAPTSAVLEASGVAAHSEGPGGVAAAGTTINVVAPHEPHDCTAGLIGHESGWSLLKKEWCCKMKDVGCQDYHHHLHDHFHDYHDHHYDYHDHHHDYHDHHVRDHDHDYTHVDVFIYDYDYNVVDKTVTVVYYADYWGGAYAYDYTTAVVVDAPRVTQVSNAVVYYDYDYGPAVASTVTYTTDYDVAVQPLPSVASKAVTTVQHAAVTPPVAKATTVHQVVGAAPLTTPVAAPVVQAATVHQVVDAGPAAYASAYAAYASDYGAYDYFAPGDVGPAAGPALGVGAVPGGWGYNGPGVMATGPVGVAGPRALGVHPLGPGGIGGLLEFDCGAGLETWNLGWSAAKKEWCCFNKNIACEEGAAPVHDLNKDVHMVDRTDPHRTVLLQAPEAGIHSLLGEDRETDKSGEDHRASGDDSQRAAEAADSVAEVAKQQQAEETMVSVIDA
eukprot:TRINITY_DN114186_c0_g1_i1.p1 TRINITY_DN114186_c0_g1~~TRINITY_DN114186_c0_g1_i1.p1  ORF type:complete len:747 (+),score=178.84 TRINITY_DN114186_c0_g1_i1:132-2372(+)